MDTFEVTAACERPMFGNVCPEEWGGRTFIVNTEVPRKRNLVERNVEEEKPREKKRRGEPTSLKEWRLFPEYSDRTKLLGEKKLWYY